MHLGMGLDAVGSWIENGNAAPGRTLPEYLSSPEASQCS